MIKKGTHVIVTTGKHRGVFYGVLAEDADYETRSLTLLEAQNVINWSQQTRGFLGLSSHGPGAGSNVGRPTPRLLLHDVNSISECSAIAIEEWEKWK